MTGDVGADLKFCLRCSKMFLYSGIGKCICAKCIAEDEVEFNIVKDYVYEHPEATIKDVAQETEVRIARIKSYLREGRLIIPDGSAVFLNCEVCETPIKFGRVCRSCADSLSNEMKRAMEISEYTIGEKPVYYNNARMRFLDNK